MKQLSVFEKGLLIDNSQLTLKVIAMRRVLYSLFFLGGMVINVEPRAQGPCEIYVYNYYNWPITLPYLCVGDTVLFSYYIPDPNAFSAVTLHWGDGSQEPINPNFIQGYMQHIFTQPGIYFPYFEAQGLNCNDTIIPFQTWGYPFPGDSLINPLPLNYFVVSAGCTPVSGRAFIDTDGDCSYSPADIPLANKMVQVTVVGPGATSGYVFTNAQGQFAFNGPVGANFRISDNQISAALTPACGTAQVGNDFEANGDYNFVFHCSSGTDLSISAAFSILAQTTYSPLVFFVYNLGCDTVHNPVVTLTLNNQVLANTSAPVMLYQDYLSISVIPVFTGTTVTIPTGLSLPPQSWLSGMLQAQANPQNTALGDEVCIHFAVGPTTGDVNLANNTVNICGTVVTSYDPNDKQGICNNKNADGEVEANADLYYTIRFQNTGNFPARDIRITDTLSQQLNLGSLQILASSHPMTTWLNDRVVTFYFDDIWLPDSASNEPASHGFVLFRIAQNPNLPPGTQILNKADIFFDYNPPIRTNTVESVIKGVGLQADETQEIRLLPNPATDYFVLSGPDRWPVTLNLYTLSGQTIMSYQITQAGHPVRLEGLPAGLYMAEVRGQHGVVARQRLVVARR